MTSGRGLEDAVWALLHEALHHYRDHPWAADRLRHELARLEEPLRVAVAGGWRSGKSTLLNAIMGEQVAPVAGVDGEDTFTWYEDGPAPGATAWSTDGVPQELAVTRSATGLRVDGPGWRPGELRDLVVRWPTRALRQLTLIDTPAVADPDERGRAPVVERALRDADALLYLTRDGRDSDLRALDSERDGIVGQAGAVHVLLVRSRADETGGGRIDALLTARQLVRRQQRDPRVAARCVHALACSGTVGLAGRMLGEADFAALAELARVPRPELDAHLLSADRFVRAGLPVGLSADARAALLERLGLFGVRLATTLVRTGCDSRVKLSTELIRRSGLTELRESVNRLFVDRQGTLKARSALVAVEGLLRAEPGPGTGELLGAVERIVAGAHEFAELRLLAALRAGRVGFAAEPAAEAQRLVGGEGTAPAARLGAEHDATARQLWELAIDAQWRWRERAEDPTLRLVQRRGAEVVARSCEGLIVELAGPPRRSTPA
ncbi:MULTISPECIES: hypothetical protein [Micromonospora]|uniref:Dynamin family protein n=1 Tax=Micromonospora haikouensis TaxID=686309 RepID=A0A0D0X697_9ACTN|nr:hypothetical protein [Micromonospora haikouensis]KIR64995.1 hypothetical protein TK50_05525 [Micromonospora haikouensis]